MRRASAILIVLCGAVAGCRGSEAQVPKDGLVVVARRPAQTAPTPAVQASPPIASELDAPWAIAFVSDASERPAKRAGRVIVVEAEPMSDVPEEVTRESDVHVALDVGSGNDKPTEEKPVAAKACSGVVNRRS